MAFLALEDYSVQIKSDLFTRLLEGDDTVRTKAEAKAISQAMSRLNVRYDINAVFAATGDARNEELVMYLVDMALYHIYSRMAPGQIPKLREDRYADALMWLKNVSSGDWQPLLPKVGDADGDGVDDKEVVQWGSNTPRDPYY
jgi:phage gp36-like protein